MLPHGYERGLMRRLLAERQSIFRCDYFQVFSEGEQVGGPGPPQVVAEDIGPTKVSLGGPFHTALNSEVFERVWRRVFSDSIFAEFGWTVKVDPDAVFLPGRLKRHLASSEYEGAMYLNNCDQGLHGPIEIVSKEGMEAFKNGIDTCVTALSNEWDHAGEDVFLRHCFGLLQVTRVDDYDILSEPVCMGHDPLHVGCGTGEISFHPFKTEISYFG